MVMRMPKYSGEGTTTYCRSVWYQLVLVWPLPATTARDNHHEWVEKVGCPTWDWSHAVEKRWSQDPPPVNQASSTSFSV